MGIAQGFVVSATFVHPEMIVPSMYYDDITFNKWPALCNMLENTCTHCRLLANWTENGPYMQSIYLWDECRLCTCMIDMVYLPVWWMWSIYLCDGCDLFTCMMDVVYLPV